MAWCGWVAGKEWVFQTVSSMSRMFFRRRRWVAVIDHGARKLNGNVMGVGMMLLMAMEGDEERLG
jgi:hypothetical protein